MTQGEYRVGITFNPSADDKVAQIKRAAADLIDLIQGIEEHPEQLSMRYSEIMRLKMLAKTAIEEGAMWAVKAATKPEYETTGE